MTWFDLTDMYREAKRPAYNERFGATAAGSADLKGSAEMPPLRQAAIPLVASGGRRNRKRLDVNANNRSERAEQEKSV